MSPVDEIIETKPVIEYSEPGDHEKFSHYAKKADLERAIFEGTPCRALCGKIWVHSGSGEVSGLRYLFGDLGVHEGVVALSERDGNWQTSVPQKHRLVGSSPTART